MAAPCRPPRAHPAMPCALLPALPPCLRQARFQAREAPVTLRLQSCIASWSLRWVYVLATGNAASRPDAPSACTGTLHLPTQKRVEPESPGEGKTQSPGRNFDPLSSIRVESQESPIARFAHATS